jgi:uncharacterized protein
MRRRLFAIMAGLFVPILVIWFGAAIIVARGLQFPPALAYSTSGPLAPGKPAAADARRLRELIGTSSEEIALRQGDGQRLNALMAPAGPTKSAVVLVYPNCIAAQALTGYFKIIRSAGYAALIIDYAPPLDQGDRYGRRGYGFGWEQRHDVLDAAAALHSRGVDRIAVLGVSEGAAAALFAGAEGAPLAAIISDSSYAELTALMRRIPPLDSLNPVFDRTVLWELGLRLGRPIDDIAPAKAAARLDSRPLIVINGADDPLVPPGDAHEIYAAASGPKELWIAPGAGHAAALATDPAQYARRVSDFLARYLGAPAPSIKRN